MAHAVTAFIIAIIDRFGYAGVAAVVFAESGLLLGFFLPGDSLLFVVGIFAARGSFAIGTVILLIFLAGVAGDILGYFIGSRLGRRVFEMKSRFIFNRENLLRTEEFFKQYGKITFIFERFIPGVRAVAPLLAGVGEMPFRTFILFDALGTALWSLSVTLLGFYLGSVIPNVDTYLLPVIFIVLVVSILPTVIAYGRHKRKKK